MSPPPRPFYLAGRPVDRPDTLTVANKFTGRPFAAVARAGPPDVDAAIAAAVEASRQTRALAGYERERILRQLAAAVEARKDEFVRTLIAEGGKPRKFAEAEVARTINTLAESAREAPRVAGEYLALDTTPRSRNYRGLWRRFPLGPVACITPFNFPLNLVAHKIGPAIAAGCPFVVKPASATPISALLLGELLAETDWPKGAFSILPCRAADAAPLAEDERIGVLSFTGSPDVGWDLRARAGRKKVVLELGGNAGVVIHADADLDDAARRCAAGAFAQAGQSCISVQRILAQRSIYDEFKRRLLAATAEIRIGDPDDPNVDVGPMIAESEAARVEQWIAEAVAAGAVVLCGGRRRGALFEPTLMENAPPGARVNRVEVFGPVATLAAYDDFDDALRIVNDSRYGLQAGVFTRDIARIWRAYETLEVGGVIINDVPTFRADHMPYGGVKASGLGREGIRFAIEDYTEIRMLVFRE